MRCGGENLIIVPTIAATDAPTSHSAVIYTEDGAFEDYAYFKNSPSVVLIDTKVIAKAPTRFLVSGMGEPEHILWGRVPHNGLWQVNADFPAESPPARPNPWLHKDGYGACNTLL